MKDNKPRSGRLVLIATLFDSLFPLLTAWLLIEFNPLVLGAGIVAGLGLGNTLYILLTGREVIQASWQQLTTLKHHLLKPVFFLTTVGRLDRPLFIAAMTLVGTTAPTLIHGLTPIGYMLVLERSMNRSRYRPLGRKSIPWLTLALLGVSLIVISHQAQIINDGWWQLTFGILLSLVSVVAASLTALHLIWGYNYLQAIGLNKKSHLETSASLLGTIITSILVAPCLLIIALILGVKISGLTLLAGIIVGLSLRTPYVVLLRVANYKTNSVCINAITYLSPVIALGFLLTFGFVSEVNIWLVATGSIAIIIANMLLAHQRSQFNTKHE